MGRGGLRSGENHPRVTAYSAYGQSLYAPAAAGFSPYHDANPVVDFFDDDAQRGTGTVLGALLVHTALFFALSSNFIVPDLTPDAPEIVPVQIVTFEAPQPDPEPALTPEPIAEPAPVVPVPARAPAPQPRPAPPPPDPNPEPEPEPEPDPVPIPDPEMVPEPEPEPEPQPEPEIIPEPEPVSPPPDILAQPTQAPDPAAIPAPDPLPEPDPDPELEPAPLPEPDLEPAPDPDPETEPEISPDPVLEPEPILEPEPVIEPLPEPIEEPLPDLPAEPFQDLIEDPVEEPVLDEVPLVTPNPVADDPIPGIITPEPLPELALEDPLVITPGPIDPDQVLDPVVQPVLDSVPEPSLEPDPAPLPVPEPELVVEPEPRVAESEAELEIITAPQTILASPEAPETIIEQRRSVSEQESDPFLDLMARERPLGPDFGPATGLTGPATTPLSGPAAGGGNIGTPPGSGTRRVSPGAQGWTLAPGSYGSNSPGQGYEGINLDMRCREAGKTHLECPEYLRTYQGRDAAGFESFDQYRPRGTGARADRATVNTGRLLSGSRAIGEASISSPSANGGGPSTNLMDDGPEVSFDREFLGNPIIIQENEGRLRDLFAEPEEDDFAVEDLPLPDPDEER